MNEPVPTFILQLPLLVQIIRISMGTELYYPYQINLLGLQYRLLPEMLERMKLQEMIPSF